MIEIGKQRVVPIRTRIGKKLVPILDTHQQPMTKLAASEVWRVTKGTLGGHFGPDGKRKLVVGLIAGDVLVLKPKGTRQQVSVELKAVYSWCLRNKALSRQLEKARKRKERLQSQRATRRMKYAEKKLLEPIEE